MALLQVLEKMRRQSGASHTARGLQDQLQKKERLIRSIAKLPSDELFREMEQIFHSISRIFLIVLCHIFIPLKTTLKS